MANAVAEAERAFMSFFQADWSNRTILELLLAMMERHLLPGSKEGRLLGHPSVSELKRWCRSGAVHVNGLALSHRDKAPNPLESLVFFPRGHNRTTLWMTREAWGRNK